MMDPYKEKLIKDLIVKMTDLGNDVSTENIDKLPFSDIAYVCVIATIHVLATFTFSRLSQEGIDDSANILEKIIDQFRMSAQDAIEDRRAELQALGEAEEPSKEDPWN